MWKLLTENLGLILGISLSFIVGIFIGLTARSDNEGIFFHYQLGNSNVAIGQNSKNYLTLDTNTLDTTNAKQISSELEKLSVTNPLSLEMRVMVRHAKGPFEPIQVTLTLRPLEEKPYGDGGEVCISSPMLDNAVLVNPPEGVGSANGMVAFKAFNHRIGCDESDVTSMWVSKEFVERWLGQEFSQDSLTVVGYLVPSSI